MFTVHHVIEVVAHGADGAVHVAQLGAVVPQRNELRGQLEQEPVPALGRLQHLKDDPIEEKEVDAAPLELAPIDLPVEVRLDPLGTLEVAAHGKLLQRLVRVVHEVHVQTLAPLGELAFDGVAQHSMRLLTPHEGLLAVGGAAGPAHELHELPKVLGYCLAFSERVGVSTLAILSTRPLARWADAANRVEAVVIVALIGWLHGSLELIPHAIFASRAARLNSFKKMLFNSSNQATSAPSVDVVTSCSFETPEALVGLVRNVTGSQRGSTSS